MKSASHSRGLLWLKVLHVTLRGQTGPISLLLSCGHQCVSTKTFPDPESHAVNILGASESKWVWSDEAHFFAPFGDNKDPVPRDDASSVALSHLGAHLWGWARLRVSPSPAIDAEAPTPIHSASLPIVHPGDSDEVIGHVSLCYSVTSGQAKPKLVDFEPLNVLGQGNFGRVVQVRRRDTGCLYAMKVIHKREVKDAAGVAHTLSERNVLRQVDHPFIVGLKYAFETDESLYMVMDYVPGGDLYFHLSNVVTFSLYRARLYTAELVLALEYLHEKGVLFRDIKPENVLIDMAGHVCLTDFGLVKENMAPDTLTFTYCGSPEYLAPEVIRRKGYNQAVDWWALGTLLYEMLASRPPFYHENVATMHNKILTEGLEFRPARAFTAEARDLCERLLCKEPHHRLGAGPDGAQAVKDHPFFAGLDWDAVYERRVPPDVRPILTNPWDVSYFDPKFTTLPLFLDPPHTRHVFIAAARVAKDKFPNFDWVAPAHRFEAAVPRDRALRALHHAEEDDGLMFGHDAVGDDDDGEAPAPLPSASHGQQPSIRNAGQQNAAPDLASWVDSWTSSSWSTSSSAMQAAGPSRLLLACEYPFAEWVIRQPRTLRNRSFATFTRDGVPCDPDTSVHT